MSNDRFNWTGWPKRVSTWLAVLSTSATAGLAAYALMPARAQAAFPEWALMAMGAIAVVSAMAVPVATSFKQRNA